MRWTTRKKRWTVIFILFCSSLCGCDPAVQEKLSYLSEVMKQPLQQYESGASETSLPTLRELLQGKEETAPIEETNTEGNTKDKNSLETMAVPGEQMDVQLFFLTSDGSDLLEETRPITKVPGVARATLEALIAGPQSQEASALFPPGTTLRDICITAEGVCKIDFSHEIQGIVSQEREDMVTLAILKTLAQFPSIQTVQFMVDGFSVNSLTGNQ